MDEATYSSVCPICKGNHLIIECSKFRGMAVNERRQCIKSDGRCFNCLKLNHGVYRCLSKPKCTSCKKKHHTLLHPDDSIDEKDTDARTDADKAQGCQLSAHITSTHHVVLPTAEVDVLDCNGDLHKCRVLLDTGSVSSFITEQFFDKLKLKRRPCRTLISGIGNSQQQVTKGLVNLSIKSKYNHMTIHVEAMILPQISGELPRQSIDIDLSSLPDIFLADARFNVPSKIDVLLGVEHVFNLIRDGRLQQNGQTVAIESGLGWILGGAINSSFKDMSPGFTSVTEPTVFDIDSTLRQFWEVEELPRTQLLTAEEEECERLFESTTTRNQDGRFVVKLPFNNKKELLGQSFWMAKTRLMSVEKRFNGNLTFSGAYKGFMNEYNELCHMSRINKESIQKGSVFIPHHGIFKRDNNSTKIRVVFDASSKTSSGLSLNDTLMVGPRVQPSLQEILLRFRQFRVAVVGDIEKMYRQILVAEEDRKFQCIVWRDNEQSDFEWFQLNTVTYGTAAAPYLATRVLKEIAKISEPNYPLVSQVLTENTYVDDVMAGADTVSGAISLKKELVAVLSSSGMNLRKWASNSKEFLETIPINDREVNFQMIEDGEATIKVLGLQWEPEKDIFTYRVRLGDPKYTKRGMLSESSKIFDPLGWLTPVTLKIKCLLQSIWTTSTNWDDELPYDIKQFWLSIRNNLSILENIQIPRWLQGLPNVELHGFSDASMRGYAAVVYARYKTETSDHECMLVTAKSKVAPIKQLSIARLELCAAHLLAKLLTKTATLLRVNKGDITAWTDSTIVLDWLNDHPAMIKSDIW